jgi:AraC-like DNA-binding protein
MKFLTIFFCLFFFAASCQDLTAFNTIYNKTFLETSQKDFNKALKIADSLYSISTTPILQAKSLMLSATLYDQSGEFEKSLEYALRSEKLIENTDNISWKARIYGFLATHYRYVRLFDKSKKYTELGINTVKGITNNELSNNVMAKMMQEMAYYHIEQKDYKESITKIELAKLYLSKIKSDDIFPVINNEQLLGYNYYCLSDLEKSLQHYENALELSKGLPENYLTGLVHNGFAQIYLKKKQLEKAKEHLDIARRIADESEYLSLKSEVYDTSEKYYALTRNIDDFVKTKDKHDTIKKALLNNAQSFVNKSYSKMEDENLEIKKTDSVKTIISGISLLLVTIVITIFFLYRKKQKKNTDKFRKLLEDLDKNEIIPITYGISNSISDHEFIEEDMDLNAEEIFTIPKITIQKILDKLEEFEKSKSYLNNSISLSYLATYCDANIKYLSYVIKTHKNNDYNNYINDLRINFIIDKLRNFPKYRNYKMSALAEEAGFSSGNKFSTIFKKTTNIPPSAFIKYLSETEINE